MTTDQFLGMVEAWYEVYAPVVQVGVILMIVAAIVVGVLIFIALLMRNTLSASIRIPPS